jgi:hypothetical protein
LAAFNRQTTREEKYTSIEELCEKGPLYGIDVQRTVPAGRILFGEDNNREKVGDLHDALARLAPFVVEGTVYMSAEGEHWKWVFKRGELKAHNGRIVYCDDLPDGWIQGDLWNAWHLPQGEPPDSVWFEVAR